MNEAQEFLKKATILVDSREKENMHLLAGFDALGIKHETRKLNSGDYSFFVINNGVPLDFSLSVAVERKSGPDELYGNIMEQPMRGQMNRLEKELEAGSRSLNQFTLLIEGVSSLDDLREYVVPEWRMKMSPARVRADIGKPCYERLRAWQAANRYNLRVECVLDKAVTARKIVENFYYYYHNYRASIAPRKPT